MFKKIRQKPRTYYSSFERKGRDPNLTHYCPGCGHGVLYKYIAEAIDDFGIQDQTILVSPVGCAVFAYHYLDVGNVQAAHGRAPAVATGIKRSCPASIVLSYQGDGDLAAIGLAEILHTANRGENLSVIFVNNVIYGMTGGQMAPTTLLDQKTATTPLGRDPSLTGYPMRIVELLSSLQGVSYLERVALTSPQNHMRTRRAIRKAIQNQMEGRGFSLVEVLSPCPTGWKMTPGQARDWVEREMLPIFPLGVHKDQAGRHRESTSGEAPPSSLFQALDLVEGESEPLAAEGRPALKDRSKEVMIAGFGGQGILSLGVLLAKAGIREGLQVSWIPSYGPEMRGGTAHCGVILSRQAIGSPLVEAPHILIAMNQPSVERFQNQIRPEGLLIYDSGLVPRLTAKIGTTALGVPAQQLAHDLGDVRVANLIILGALINRDPFLRRASIENALEAQIRNRALSVLDRKALALGYQFQEHCVPPCESPIPC